MTRRFFRFGAIIFLIGGLGHLVLVDVWKLPGVRPLLEPVTLDFAVLGEKYPWAFGSTNAWRAVAGFSAWMTVSLPVLGILLLAIAAQAHARLRPFQVIALVTSVLFGAISAYGFIWLPAFGAVMATVAFSVSLLREK